MSSDVLIRILALPEDLPKDLNDLKPIAEINSLLRAAYQSSFFAEQEFAAADEPIQSTLKRLREGECIVACIGESWVGCLILRTQSKASAPVWYQNSGVASFGRFAVHPNFQNQGIGSKLLTFAESRAKELGMSELALDTSERSVRLIEFYQKRGYQLVSHHQWKATSYRSVVLSKVL